MFKITSTDPLIVLNSFNCLNKLYTCYWLLFHLLLFSPHPAPSPFHIFFLNSIFSGAICLGFCRGGGDIFIYVLRRAVDFRKMKIFEFWTLLRHNQSCHFHHFSLFLRDSFIWRGQPLKFFIRRGQPPKVFYLKGTAHPKVFYLKGTAS